MASIARDGVGTREAHVVKRGFMRPQQALQVDADVPDGSTVPGPLVTAIGFWFVVVAPVMFLGAYPIKPMLLLAVALMPILALVLLPRGLMAEMRISLPLVGYVSWAILSFLWSESPDGTKLYIRTFIVSVVAMSIVASYLPRPIFVNAFLRSMELIIFLTVFAVLTSASARSSGGTIGAVGDGAGWSGFFGHKNFMAPVIALATIAVLAFERNRTVVWSAVIAATVLLIGSQSVTGMSIFFLGLFFWYWTGLLSRGDRRDRTTVRVGSSLFAVVLIGAVVNYVGAVVDSVGKDLTFSSRTDIWDLTWPLIFEQPIQGYGLAGPFSDLRNQVALETFRSLGFYVQHAHNGVIDLLVTLGVVGVAFVSALVIGSLRAAWRAIDRSPRLARWVIASILILVMLSFSEAAFAGQYVALIGTMRILLMIEERDARVSSSYREVSEPIARDL